MKIKVFFAICFNRLLKFAVSLKWKTQAYKIRKNIAPRKLCTEIIAHKSLILVPHQDDELIGCSSLITSKKTNVILLFLSMGRSDSPDMQTARNKELSEIEKRFSKKIVFSHDDKIQEIVSIIESQNITDIFVPFSIDWNDGHLNTIKLLRGAVACLGPKTIENMSIYTYQISCPIPPDIISVAIPFSRKQFKNKWRAFCSIYKTQKAVIYPRFSMNEIINGGLVNAFSAEVFARYSVYDWTLATSFLPDDSDKKRIKENLNNLLLIRKIIDEIWTEKNKNENRKDKEHN